MNAAQLINQTSGKVEYYTPQPIIDAAKKVMCEIDLDPASTHIANMRIGAKWIYTIEDDGLKHNWQGRVWMNHPFGRGLNKPWVDKLVSEYRKGNVTQACMICYACTSEQWFQPLYDFPLCFLNGRTNYILPNGEVKRGVTKGSVVIYMGPRRYRFGEYFSPLGRIMLPT